MSTNYVFFFLMVALDDSSFNKKMQEDAACVTNDVQKKGINVRGSTLKTFYSLRN